MKKLFNLIAFTIIVCASCQAQVAEKASNAEGQSLLWEISGNGLEKSSYLFGTLHLIPKDSFFLPAGTETAFETCETLVLEVDIDIPLKEQIAMAQRVLIPNNETIADFMSDDEYKAAVSYMVDSIGISEKKMQKYIHIKPFFLSGILLTEALGKVEAYETYFAALAKKQDKSFIALETLEFQLAIFDTISVEEQVEASFHSDMMAEYYDMLECYAQQNLDCLYTMITEYDDIEFEQLFLLQRNHNWAEKLEKDILPAGSTFIAVGAGHLPGNEGVIKLLQERGYTVEPVLEVVE